MVCMANRNRADASYGKLSGRVHAAAARANPSGDPGWAGKRREAPARAEADALGGRRSRSGTILQSMIAGRFKSRRQSFKVQ